MRNPLRSEADAFRFVLLTIGYFALIVIGSVINTWVGLAVFVVLTRRRGLGGSSVAATRRRPCATGAGGEPAGRAPHPRRRERDGRRARAARRDPRRGRPAAHASCSSSARRSTRRSGTGSPTRTRRAQRPQHRLDAEPRGDARSRARGDRRGRRRRSDPGDRGRAAHVPARRADRLDASRRDGRTGSSAASSRRRASGSRCPSPTSSSTSMLEVRADRRAGRSAAAARRAARGASSGARCGRALRRLGARTGCRCTCGATTSCSSSRARAPSSSGFGYGYTGAYGQWWTEHVARALTAAQREQWLDPPHFEIVELHVRPVLAAAGRGQRAARAAAQPPAARPRAPLDADRVEEGAQLLREERLERARGRRLREGLPALPRARQEPGCPRSGNQVPSAGLSRSLRRRPS